VVLEEELWVSHLDVDLSLEMLPRWGAPLLRRCGAFLRRVVYLLRGGSLPLYLTLTCGELWEHWEMWQPLLSHCHPFSQQVVRPPSLGSASLLLYIEAFAPSIKLDMDG